MVEKTQGSGSLWNVNSWHWEQKNYTPVAKELIKQMVEQIVFEKDSITITTARLKNINGEAEVNIRKGKTIMCYDFNLEVEWKGERGADQAEGSYKVNEINPDDVEDMEIDNVKQSSKTSISKDCENLIKINFKDIYKKLFKDFPQKLANPESDPKKLEEDKRKREEAQVARELAKEQNGHLKDQIFKEQQEKEKLMKEQFSQQKEGGKKE